MNRSANQQPGGQAKSKGARGHCVGRGEHKRLFALSPCYGRYEYSPSRESQVPPPAQSAAQGQQYAYRAAPGVAANFATDLDRTTLSPDEECRQKGRSIELQRRNWVLR